MTKRLTVTARVLPDGQIVTVVGREAQTLRMLVQNKAGISSLHHPGIRLAAYIHDLRGFGFSIETVHESHGGPFAGTHARYVLRSEVDILSDSDEQEAA